MRSLWISDVKISPAVAHKLRLKHGVSVREVREAALYGLQSEARWHVHPIYGRRLLVRGHTDGGVELVVVLRPPKTDGDTWTCATARRI